MNKLEVTKVERTKMPRINRAVQFAPFNSLRDLPDEIHKSEKTSEKGEKRDVDEQTSNKISDNLMSIDKNSEVYIKYFYEGFEREYIGRIKIDFEKQQIIFEKQKIPIIDLLDLDIIGDFKY